MLILELSEYINKNTILAACPMVNLCFETNSNFLYAVWLDEFLLLLLNICPFSNFCGVLINVDKAVTLHRIMCLGEGVCAQIIRGV